ncbi:hypothetical protein NPX13_g5393 [Xylaria arbuscula]|uniref:Uncharacterized protein n=1 Tax=Xylaria arbuscula TaxID=114810 RepID=A0A9W8NEJ4_9PEZI|nr:hypothetical protein NPX13_g5393 [Xylaria arbuscula]
MLEKAKLEENHRRWLLSPMSVIDAIVGARCYFGREAVDAAINASSKCWGELRHRLERSIFIVCEPISSPELPGLSANLRNSLIAELAARPALRDGVGMEPRHGDYLAILRNLNLEYYVLPARIIDEEQRRLWVLSRLTGKGT